MPKRSLLLVPIVLAAVGCSSSRNDHAVDTINLTPEQERDVFVTSGNLGPDQNVIVIANVPKARYDNGAIVLTGGKEVYVVQPHAWRTSTGTALSAEEAERIIARAEKLDVAVRDVGAAASDLRVYLESRSSEARVESERMRKQDEAWRADQERQSQKMLDEAARLRRTRDQEISKITNERDEKVASIYQEGSNEIQVISDQFTKEVSNINNRYATIEAKEVQAYQDRADKLAKSQKFTLDVAKSKTQESDYVPKLEENHDKERQELLTEHKNAIGRIHADRDNDLQKVRSDAARKVDDARRLSEEKVERIRKAADAQIAEVRAKQAVEAIQAPTTTAPGGLQ